jgi:hypothetical protein
LAKPASPYTWKSAARFFLYPTNSILAHFSRPSIAASIEKKPPNSKKNGLPAPLPEENWAFYTFFHTKSPKQLNHKRGWAPSKAARGYRWPTKMRTIFSTILRLKYPIGECLLI